MKRGLFSLVLALAGTVAACDSHSVSGPVAHDEIVGSWISTGADIAPGVVSTLKPRRVEATFEPSHTYAIVVTDSAYAVTVFSGTWTGSGTPGGVRVITLLQRSPAGAAFHGIFRVSGRTLTFEVIQDSVEFTPPTVAGGFGSTSRDGVALGAFWTQTFSRQDESTASDCNPGVPAVTTKRPCDTDWNGAVPKGWK